MGITLSIIQKMQNQGLFNAPAAAILDIGSSNLYQASLQGIKDFLTARGIAPSEHLNFSAKQLEEGSAYRPEGGNPNTAFAGQLFDMAGMQYASIDIAAGYKTTILDLNHQSAPSAFRNAFDLVLNFGTTEHLLNQYNAFKVIHDCTKVGGYIVHQLPCTGYSNHGYLTYTPRCMFDLAAYNQYELFAFWFEGPGALNDLYAPIRDYQAYFSALTDTLRDGTATDGARRVADLRIPDVGLNAIFRKVKDAAFTGPLERSTSVGDVPDSIFSAYENSAPLAFVDVLPVARAAVSLWRLDGARIFLARRAARIVRAEAVARRLRDLEEENFKLRRQLADSLVDVDALKSRAQLG